MTNIKEIIKLLLLLENFNFLHAQKQEFVDRGRPSFSLENFNIF